MVNLYIFNESGRAAVYGIGTYMRELTTALKDSNINVCVVNLHSEKQDAETTDDIQYLRFPPPFSRNTSSDWNRQYELYYQNIVFLLRLQIKNTENLVFHLNYNQSGKLAEELKKAFDCKIVTVVHYSEWGFIVYDNLPRLRAILKEEHLSYLSKNLKNRFETEKSLYAKTDRIVCLSNYMFDILCRDYELDTAKISVIPNGLTDMAKTGNYKNLLRKKWKIPVKEKILLFAGRIDEIKGIEFLIKAFRDVLSTFPNSRLIVAGEGAFSKYTKESQDICTKITYTGMLKKNLLYEWYQMADVGVTPSLFEPFGYVAVEMMMNELPVVATATSGLNEVVDDTCGLKIPIITHSDRVEIDAGLLAEKIIFMLQHPSEAKMMGKNGRKRFLKKYSSEVFRQKMIDFYRSLSSSF